MSTARTCRASRGARSDGPGSMPSVANYWTKQMSTRSSFKEALARPGAAKASARGRSASAGVRLILRAGDIARPVDVARLLAQHGLSLRKAHDTLNRLTNGEGVAVELRATEGERLCSELSRLGVMALPIH